MIQKTRDLVNYLYQHHFVRYLIVGGSTFLLDFGILFILHGKFSLNLAASTSVAYWVSVMYNFLLNRYWTFDAREKDSLKHHITAYFILLVANYLFTVTFVSVVGEHISYVVAKMLAVAISMTWTYTVYKRHIFINTK